MYLIKEVHIGFLKCICFMPINLFYKSEGHRSRVSSHRLRGFGGVVGLMLPLALAAAVRVSFHTSPRRDLGQVVNLSPVNLSPLLPNRSSLSASLKWPCFHCCKAMSPNVARK